MSLVTIIVACDPDGVIGKENKLPWRCKEDLQLFRQRTYGHAVIMGRKTWDSIPKKPLDGRANIVVSRNMWLTEPNRSIFYYASLEGAIRSVKESNHCSDHYGISSSARIMSQYCDKDIFIIGGAQVYKEALKKGLVDRIIMSKMNSKYEGDVYFPDLDDRIWEVTQTEEHDGFDVLFMDKNANQSAIDKSLNESIRK